MVALLADASLVASRGEARRLVTQGAVRLDGQPVGSVEQSWARPSLLTVGRLPPSSAGARVLTRRRRVLPAGEYRHGPESLDRWQRWNRCGCWGPGAGAKLTRCRSQCYLLQAASRKFFETEDLSGTTPTASASEDGRSPSAKRIRSDGCSVAVLTPSRWGLGGASV